MRVITTIALYFLFVNVFGNEQNQVSEQLCDKVRHQASTPQKNVRKSGKGGGFEKTLGAVWPKPQMQKSSDVFMVVLPSKFSFKIIDQTCDIVDAAFKRYYALMFNPPRMTRPKKNTKEAVKNWFEDKMSHGLLDTLEINLSSKCDNAWPDANMDEQYELKINTADRPGKATLYAQSVWGIVRGLETFSQLVYRMPDGFFLVNTTLIRDFPRFPFRGIMLDTARHYLPKRVILDNLETMAQNKLNVFHWHIVDDQAFPFESRAFPSMSTEGAYNDYTHVYTFDDIVDIVYFARMRGIRVIPEFDTPGHTDSWGLGMPGLLTPCYKNVSGTLKPNGFGPIDPTKESTYDFLKVFMKEATDTFPDSFIHLGGDEVSFDCWKSNPDVQKFMNKMGFGTDYSKLEQYYMQRLLEIIKSFPRNNSYIIWQEVIDNGATVKPDTVVEVWKSPYEGEMYNVTKKGYRTLLSACWYLNYITYGTDWVPFYLCDPQSFKGTPAQKKLVMGGEACMWGEWVDATNLTPRLWPRASTTAERLWSDASVNDPDEAAPRLEEHRCRMLIRGINAEPPNGPSFCPVDFKIF